MNLSDKIRDLVIKNKMLANVVKLEKVFKEITDEDIEKYGDIFLDYINRLGSIPQEWKNKNFIIYLAKQNSSSLYLDDLVSIFREITEEDIEKYGDIFFNYINNEGYIPQEWENNKALIIYLAQHNLSLLSLLELGNLFKEITKENIDKYGEIILNYIRKDEYIPFAWKANQDLISYTIKHDRNLLYMFDLSEYFGNITLEILNEYGEIILKYIENNFLFFDSWKDSKILFDYVKENRKDLLYKLNIEKFFPNITLEVLNENRDIILEYIESSFLFSYSWKNSKILFDYIKENRKDLLYKLNMENFFPNITLEVLNENKDIILEYIENSFLVSDSWKDSKILFDYIKENRKDLLYKLNMEKFFPNITLEVLNENKDIILEYIRNSFLISDSWKNNEILFDYIKENRRELLYKLNIEKFLPNITLETLKDNSDIILEYIENSYSIPNSWENNKILFNYIKENRRDLLYKLNIERFFPNITLKTLKDNGDIILEYIENSYSIPNSWENNKILFDYIKENRRDLLYKLNIEKFFKEITHEVLNEYGDIILKYIEKSYITQNNWKDSKILFDYVKENRKDLLYNLNIEKFFKEITNEVLKDNGDIILEYIENSYSIPNSWENNKILFDYIKENRRDLLYKLNIEKFFKEITHEVLNEYGDIILKYIEKSYITQNNWKDSKILFDYVKENRKDLLYKLNIEKFFKEITHEVLKDNGDIILKYIEIVSIVQDNWRDSKILFDYVRTNRIDLLSKLNIEKLFFESGNLEYFANLYGIDKYLLESKMRYLYGKNNDIFETLNFNILKIEGFSKNLLSKFTLYPDIQEKIIKLDSNTLLYFIKIANTLNIKDSDLTSVIMSVLDNINNYGYLLAKIPISELDEERIKNLVFVIGKSDDIFNIDNIDDLTDRGLQKKQDEYFKNIVSNLDKMDTFELKNAIVEKLYGIDYYTAESICNMYASNLEELEGTKISPKILNILSTLNKIMKTDSIDALKLMYRGLETSDIDFNYGMFLESAIRKEFASIYKDTLYQLKDEDKSKNPCLQNVTYDGKKIEFYEVSDDFNMQIHVLGAYGYFKGSEDFQNEWDVPKISVHGICTSYIGNNQIATAPPRGPILGFAGYEDSALLLSGNYDLGSINRSFSVIADEGRKTRFLPPKSMINGTRHNHNEMVIERTISLEDGTLIKRKPSYIVYLVDDINNQDNFSDTNNYYQMILQASHDFNVPIVIVDRLKFARRELKKCLNLEKEFLETKDSKVLEELFLTYMNNAVGCREFTGYEVKEYHKVFNESVIREFYKRIYSYLKGECDNLDNNNVQKLGDNIVTLLKLLIHEKESYASSHKSYMLSPYIDLDLEIENLKKLLEEYKKKVSNIPNITIENIDESHISM